MRRSELEHVIRAAAVVAEDDELVIVGSQAILGQFPDAPAEMLVSREADVYPRNRPARSDEIDGSLGEGSSGWEGRLVAVHNENTGGATPGERHFGRKTGSG